MKSRNFHGTFATVVSGAANTDITITHGLGAIPRGYLVTRRSAAGSLYLGTGTWTSTTASLKSSTANTIYLVLFFI